MRTSWIDRQELPPIRRRCTRHDRARRRLCGLAAAMMLARDGHRRHGPRARPGAAPRRPRGRLGALGPRRRRRSSARRTPAARAARQVLEDELPDVLRALHGGGSAATSTRSHALPPDDHRPCAAPGRRAARDLDGARARRSSRSSPGPPRPRPRVESGAASRVTAPRDPATAACTSPCAPSAATARSRPRDRRDGPRSALPKLLAARRRSRTRRPRTAASSTTRASSAASCRDPRARCEHAVGTFSILTLPGDDGDWSLTLFASAGDRPLKALRDPERWTALVRACPSHAHWLDGEPITGVMPMGGVIDRYRAAATAPAAARHRQPRRRVGVHEPVARPRHRARPGARRARCAASCASTTGATWPRRSPPRPSASCCRATDATVARRPRAAGRDQRAAHGERRRPTTRRASPRSPAAMSPRPRRVPRRAGDLSCLALPREVFARPGFAERVLEAARRTRRRRVGPTRDECCVVASRVDTPVSGTRHFPPLAVSFEREGKLSRIHATAAAGVAALATRTRDRRRPRPPHPRRSWTSTPATSRATQLAKLVELGIDRHEIELSKAAGGEGSRSTSRPILSGAQAQELADDGVELEPKEIDGQTVTERATLQAAAGFEVFKQYAGAGGLKEEFPRTARRTRLLAKLVTIGKTTNGQDIVALKLTQRRAAATRDGSKPSTLYIGAQHAREWITPEMNRRLMHYLIDSYSAATAHPPAAQRERAVDRPGRQPGRLRLHVQPGPAAVAQEPARQRRRRHDRPRATASTSTATGLQVGLRQRGLLARPASETYRGPGRELRARDARRSTRSPSASASSSSSTTTRRPSCCSTASAGRSPRRRRTTSSPRR